MDDVGKTMDTHPDIRWMSWNEIASASGLGELMGRCEYMTVRKEMKRRGRHKRIAVQKDELPEPIAKKRLL